MRMLGEKEQQDLERMLVNYLSTALWNSTLDDGDPLATEYGIQDIDQDFVELSRQECYSFLNGDHDDSELTEIMAVFPSHLYAPLGKDLAHTRMGSGVWFGDGDWDFTKEGGEDLGDRLTARAERFAAIELYVGDDYKVHATGA